MTGSIVIGVLALQGAFHEHFKLLQKASLEVDVGQDEKWEFMEVRTAPDLERCDALIIPGGESTTVSLVAARSNLLEPLREFVKYVPPHGNPFSIRRPLTSARSQSTSKTDLGHLCRTDSASRIGQSHEEGGPRAHRRLGCESKS